jgi:hypothetical protein
MGGSGDLRNFGFALTSPDFEQMRQRSSRGPNFVYDDAAAMAVNLNEIAADYPPKASEPKSGRPVPEMKNVRLAVNVASCDGLPCLVLAGPDEIALEKMKRNLSEVIWDNDVAGLFIFGSTVEKDDLSMIDGKLQSGFLVVRPDAFGVKGEVITTLAGNLTGEALKKELLSAIEDYQRISKTHGMHVREGRQTDIEWKTAVEVPDKRRR